MNYKSIRFKFSILYTSVLGIILIIYSGFFYFSLSTTLYSDLDKDLKTKARVISDTIHSYLEVLGEDDRSLDFAIRRIITLKGDHPLQDDILDIEQNWLRRFDQLNLQEDYIHFASVQGRSIVKSRNLENDLRAVLLSNVKLKKGEAVTFRKFKFEKRNLQFVQIPFYFQGEPRYIIQVGTSQMPIIDFLKQRVFSFVVFIPIILFLTSFVSRLLVVRTLKPVTEITKTARNITHNDLSRRIHSQDVDEELLSLVQAFNEMIARLERSFKLIEEFSSQVAHELKTPIAVIRGECELSLRRSRNAEEYRRVISVNLEEAQRMLKLVEDLLLLAKLDYRADLFKFDQIEVNKFFEEIQDQGSMLALEKSIDVRLQGPSHPLVVHGDPVHLRRLFFNIIHNAIKFTPPQGNIHIRVRQEKQNLVTTISDTGIGITQEDLPRILDRFFRVDRTEQIQESGHGLGLNIAQSIAKIHGGHIRAESQVSQGAVFIVILPLVQPLNLS